MYIYIYITIIMHYTFNNIIIWYNWYMQEQIDDDTNTWWYDDVQYILTRRQSDGKNFIKMNYNWTIDFSQIPSVVYII